MSLKKNQCYCAFCRNVRNVYRKKHVNVVDILVALIISTLLMFVVWQRVNPMAALFVVAFICLNETLIQLRWRLNISCKYCGFDPVLYVQNPEKAAEKVKAFLARRRQSPDIIFAHSLDLPVVKVKKALVPLAKGANVSKII